MHSEELIKRVQHRVGLETQEGTLKAVQATLETLGERLPRKTARGFSAQLPHDLRACFLQRQDARQPFDLDEFYNRVSARADFGRPLAVACAQAVIKVLYEAVSAGEMADVRLELTPEYDPLFQDAEEA